MSELLSISKGNDKLGRIPNISTRPVLDCGNCSHCAKSCYAMKAYRLHPSVKKAWDRNGLAFRGEDYATMYDDMQDYLEHRVPQFFRVHVAGDMISQGSLDFWYMVADNFPCTTFLAFTKMFHLDYSDKPRNITNVYSMWPGMEDTAPAGPRAWMQDGTETRVPDSAIPCPGKCDVCGMCWSLPTIGRDVVFNIH